MAITLPPGAFAAAKAGTPQPTQTAPKADAGAKPAPKPEPKPAPKAEPKPAPKADAGDEPTPAERKIWKLKADGEEFDFDASDEEAIKREIMKARGADKRFAQGAADRKVAEQFFSMLKSPDGLRKVLTDPRVGVDVKAFAEQIVWEQIQQQQREAEWEKDPAKKKAWEDEQELKRLRDEKAAREADAENAKKQQEAARYEGEYTDKITKALDAGGLPKTPATVERMAARMMQALEHGYDLAPEELVELVRQDLVEDFKHVFGDADGDQLLALLGDGNAKKIREADLKRLKSPTQHPFPQRQNRKPAENRQQQAPKRLSGSDWRKELEKGFLGRKK